MKTKEEGMIVFLAVGFALFCAASPTVAKSTINVKEPTQTAGQSKGGKNSVPKLNESAVNYSRELIQAGHVVADESRASWSEHQPSAEEENEFIRLHGFDEYAKWHLGIDEGHAENTKARYKFPYGDFRNVHRCALLAAKSRAGQYKYHDIENAADQLAELIGMKKKLQEKR
jgi:hypothetical protein